MAIFATNERLTFNDIQRHHGPVLKLVDIAESYIKSNIHWRVEFTGALQRTEIPEIPIDAIREALLTDQKDQFVEIQRLQEFYITLRILKALVLV